jgi:hypothetical protein
MGGTVNGCTTDIVSDVQDPARHELWFPSNDGTGTQADPIIADDGTGNMAVHASGSGFTTWGGGVAFNVAAEQAPCYTFAGSTGIRFRAKGPGNIYFAAPISGVVPVENGGTCAENCEDSHKRVVGLSAEWTTYEFTWNQLYQAGWGTGVPFNAADILNLTFTASPEQQPFDFWIDDVQVVGTPTGSGGTPGTGGTGVVTTGGTGGTGPMISGFAEIVTKQMFESWFPSRNPFYTYEGLVEATYSFSGFAASAYDMDTRKREIAAFLANVRHESDDLQAIEQYQKDVYCQSSASCPCEPGKQYFGRGPLLFSWNYIYFALLSYLSLGDQFRANPDLLATNATYSWSGALWFWMQNSGAGTMTCHVAMTGGAGFGETIRSINGGLECGANWGGDKGPQRVSYYQAFCDALGVSYGDNLTC